MHAANVREADRKQFTQFARIILEENNTRFVETILCLETGKTDIHNNNKMLSTDS